MSLDLREKFGLEVLIWIFLVYIWYLKLWVWMRFFGDER